MNVLILAALLTLPCWGLGCVIAPVREPVREPYGIIDPTGNIIMTEDACFNRPSMQTIPSDRERAEWGE